MIEKDNIQDLFSKAFENQTAPVNPDVWTGIQAKMAAAGVAGAGTAAKGMSLLSKWLIGTGVVGSIGAAATVILMNGEPQETNKEVDTTPTTEITNNNPTVDPIQKENNETPGLSLVTSEEQTETPQKDILVKRIDDETTVYVEDPAPKAVTPVIIKPTTPETTVVLSPVVESLKEEVAPEVHPETEENKMVVLRKQVVEFPNVFTPNNDGVNDFYSVKIEHIKEVEVQIMNQKNVIVFRSNDPNFQWDGRVNGEPCDEGMYVCIVVGKAENGKSFKDMQMFQVIR